MHNVVRIEVRRTDERFMIRISDNGKGLPAAEASEKPGRRTGRALMQVLAR